MKKLLLASLISAFLLLVERANSQNPVFPSIAVNPAAVTFNVNDVDFLNKDTAIAVGTGGMAWQSTDGGLNWNTIPTFTSTVNNNAVYMEDNYICIAGDMGMVSFSRDRGLTWQNAAQAQPTLNYHGLDFADTTFGISVGDAGVGLVYKWSGVFGWINIPSGLTQKLNAVAAFKTSVIPIADGHGIAVGDHGSVATYAAGAWAILSKPVNSNINGVYLFNDHTTVLAVGDSGLIMRSQDLGITWSILNYGDNEALNDISEGVTSNQFVAVGNSGVIYVSSDTGHTFSRYTVGFTSSDLKCVSAKIPRGSFGGSGSTLRSFSPDGLTSVRNKTGASEYSVSPNPASDILNVDVAGDLTGKTIQLYSVYHDKVFAETILKDKNSYDVSGLSPGVYFLVVDGHASKILIEK